jgi:predicted membrane protein (TIGR00267 family)
VVTAGLAEIAAGSIAMGLGGYLAARSDAEHYASERTREEREVVAVPDVEAQEVEQIFEALGLTAQESAPVVEAIRQKPKSWVDLMMRMELGLEEPDPKRALTSALTIGGAYILGGSIPLAPYILVPVAQTALLISVIVTMAALFVFGVFKGHFTGTPPLRSGIQTLVIGGLAAGAAFGIAKLIS